MPSDVTFAGRNGWFTLAVHGYEYPKITTGADANWVTSRVELRVDARGTFSAVKSVTLRTHELAAFAAALDQLLGTLTGSASLEHLDEEVGMEIRMEYGGGTIHAFVQSHDGTRLDALIETDQSFLGNSARDLRAVVLAFPVRGDAYA